MTDELDVTDRLRLLLSGEDVREQPMFGVRAFLVHGRIVICVGKDESLLVRVLDERHDELVGEDGASQAEMGGGRSFGPGWLHIDPPASIDALEFWFDAAMERSRAEYELRLRGRGPKITERRPHR